MVQWEHRILSACNTLRLYRAPILKHKKKSASKTEFQTFAFFVNLNWVIVARCSESLIKIITTKGSQHVYWSVPAALLVRFRGDALGEALSETQEVKIKYSEIKITVRKQNKAEGEWSSVIITAGQNELTHGIKSLLRNPADVHIIYSSSALFYFHRKPLFLQNTHKGRKPHYVMLNPIYSPSCWLYQKHFFTFTLIYKDAPHFI